MGSLQQEIFVFFFINIFLIFRLWCLSTKPRSNGNLSPHVLSLSNIHLTLPLLLLLATSHNSEKSK